MNRILEYLVAGLIAAAATGVVAGVVVWKIGERQRDFVAKELAAQSAKIQDVGSELAKTAADLKALSGALKTTNDTLGQVKDQVSLVGTRSGIAELNGKVEAANKALAEIKQATAPERSKGALAPLADKLDAAGKALAALQAKSDDKTRDQALARIETALAGVKDAIAKQPADPGLAKANAKLDDALKSLAAIKSSASANSAKFDRASKSLTALDTAMKKGFADTSKSQADLMKAVEKPAPAVRPVAAAAPAKGQDLVVFYVSMAGAAPAPRVPAQRRARADAGRAAAVYRALREARRRRRRRPDEADRRQGAHPHQGTQRLRHRGGGPCRHARRRPNQL